MDPNSGKSSVLINKGSVYDLATLYITLYVGRNVNKDEFNNIVDKFSCILDKGYTSKECINIILLNMNNKHNFHIMDILKHTSKHENIIKQNQMYYHKELRIQPKPNTIDIDYNTGTMVSTKQEYFVEIVASYTIEDLLKYLLSFGYTNTYQWQYTRLKGLMKHYIKKYGIDTVLFMFEAIANNIEEKEFDFNKFDNYYQMAKSYMNNIINNCIANGGDKIVQRKRKQII